MDDIFTVGTLELFCILSTIRHTITNSTFDGMVKTTPATDERIVEKYRK